MNFTYVFVTLCVPWKLCDSQYKKNLNVHVSLIVFSYLFILNYLFLMYWRVNIVYSIVIVYSINLIITRERK